ncbi:MAG: hypothetical protein CVU11_14150 [Bacteroidetes bacterium HGW-Bacteroidetes-6]|jgi:hypothetical protein|nr:MAG: hypothetical protein CVU11_14150 [Bacteroidetes bacterium HGW-Bacteroidetes-6]
MTNKLLLLLVVGLLAISCTKTSKEVDFVDSLFTNAKDGNREAVSQMFSDYYCDDCGMQSKSESIDALIEGMQGRELLPPDEIFWANDGSIHYHDKKYVNGRQLKVIFDISKKGDGFEVTDMIVLRIMPLELVP